MTQKRKITVTLLTLVSSLMACDAAMDEAHPPTQVEAALALMAENDLELTALERAPVDEDTYRADLAWFQEKALNAPLHRAQLDLRDPLAYRFVLGRLQRRGYTVAEHPVIFKKLRAMHLGRMPENTEAAKEEAQSTSTSSSVISSEPCSVLARSIQTPIQDQYGNTVSSKFSFWTDGSCDGGADYAYVDTMVYSFPAGSSWNLTPLGYQQTEVWGWMNENPITLVSTTPIEASINGQYGLSVDSLSTFEKSDDGSYLSFYTYETYYSPTCRLTLTSPVDRTGDGKTTICLNRSSADCDVSYAYNTSTNLAIPTVARLLYSVPANPNATVSAVNSVRADIFLGSTGTSCQTVVQNPVVTKLSNTTYELRLDGTNGSAPIAFSKNCAKESNKVLFNLKVSAQGTEGTCQADGPADSTVGKPISFIYSCLKPDTLIQLADGSERRVDEVVAAHDRGEVILMPGKDGRLMRMAASVVGPSEELIRLEDEVGHVIETSFNHPIITPNGPMQAEKLRAGDLVETVDGPRLLKQVSRVPYEGLTYNLSLAPAIGELPEEDNRITADGFLVGDFRLQMKLGDEPLRRISWRK